MTKQEQITEDYYRDRITFAEMRDRTAELLQADRIIRKAETRIRSAEVEKRTIIHTDRKVNWSMTASDKANAMRLNRRIESSNRAIRRAELGTIFA